GGDVRVLAIFQETRALVLAEKLDEGWNVRLPVHRKPFELLEDRIDARLSKQRNRVLRVLVEVGVEDPLVHEVLVLADVKQNPSQVVELEGREHMRIALHRILKLLSVLPDFLFCPRFDLRDNCETVTSRRPWEERTVSSLFHFEITFLRDRHRL